MENQRHGSNKIDRNEKNKCISSSIHRVRFTFATKYFFTGLSRGPQSHLCSCAYLLLLQDLGYKNSENYNLVLSFLSNWTF